MGGSTVDSTLLITLGSVRALSILTDSTLHEWFITPIVRGELKSEPTRGDVERAILAGRIRPAELDLANKSHASALAKWSSIVDPGEAEAIAVAEVNGWAIAIEDLQARRAVERSLGGARWLNCANLLLDAIASERASLPEADAVFQRLDCYSSYVKRGVVSLLQLQQIVERRDT